MTPDDVKAARIRLGMTQSQLADALGLVGGDAVRTVRRWEAGERPIGGPAAQLLRMLLQAASPIVTDDMISAAQAAVTGPSLQPDVDRAVYQAMRPLEPLPAVA